MRLTVHYGKDGGDQKTFRVRSEEDMQIGEGRILEFITMVNVRVTFKEWVYFTLDT